MTNRIKQLRELAGLTLEELGEAAGTTKGQIWKLETGLVRLNQKWLERLAAPLQVKPSEILYENDIDSQALEKMPIGENVMVIGEVQAGVWVEATQWDDEDRYTIPLARTSNNKNAYGLKIKGDSMNLCYPEGTVLIVSPLADMDLQNGDHVIVQRHKKDGITEATVKELVIKNGKAELWCRSSNPKWQNPINIHWPYEEGQKIDTEIVEIIGVVTADYRERKR